MRVNLVFFTTQNLNLESFNSNFKSHNRIRKSFGFVLLLSLVFCSSLYAQNDTITLKNGDTLEGEIKLILEGVLTIETDYSDKDFKIDFDKVNQLVIQSKCIIVLTNNRRRFGYVKSNEAGKVTITLENDIKEDYKISEIISLSEIREKFLQRFSAAIDFSYNFAKANKTDQFAVSGKLNYKSELWRFEAFINSLNSNQEDVEKTRRTEANLEFVRLLSDKLYIIGEVPFLSNTEQALDSRVSPSIGVGKFIVSTNKLYLGLSTGFTFNIENYANADLDKNSTEIFVSSSLKMYDVKDFDLQTDIKFYPSISEKGRIRTDYNLTLKYDLLKDFYVKLGFSLNYDNKPAISGNDVDYIFTSGLGWSFN